MHALRRIQRYAWFNSGYQFMRQTTEAGFAVDSAPRAVFLPVVRPQMRCIMAVMDQQESLLAVACARLVLLVFYTSRCVPCCCSQALMPCIMAFMDHKDRVCVFYYAGSAGDNAPRAVFLGSQAHDA